MCLTHLKHLVLPLQDRQRLPEVSSFSRNGTPAQRSRWGLWRHQRMNLPYEILIPDETRTRLAEYEVAVRSGNTQPGARLAATLNADHDFLTALLRTKQPLIFAESAVAGDGSDWNLTELGMLGDISVAMRVTIFDDGRHSNPEIHPEPLEGGLVFVPGALLRSGGPGKPADWDEVVNDHGELVAAAYDALYVRRLLPGFRWIEEQAGALGQPAFVTLPGLGCGQFAGPFRGKLGAVLERALRRLLDEHGGEFPSIRTVVFDPYDECQPARAVHGGIDFRVRPLTMGGRPQLSLPQAHSEDGEDLSDCRLFSFVAWDHVSWPGNDFFGGARCTDDGVKAAATDSMARLTGVTGSYSKARHAYLPPAPHATWGELVRELGVSFP